MERDKNCVIQDWESTEGREAQQYHALRVAFAQTVNGVPACFLLGIPSLLQPTS